MLHFLNLYLFWPWISQKISIRMMKKSVKSSFLKQTHFSRQVLAKLYYLYIFHWGINILNYVGNMIFDKYKFKTSIFFKYVCTLKIIWTSSEWTPWEVLISVFLSLGNFYFALPTKRIDFHSLIKRLFFILIIKF